MTVAECPRSVVEDAVVSAGVGAVAPGFVGSVLLPELSCFPATAFCCAVVAVGSVLPESLEPLEASVAVCDCVDEAFAPAVFGVAVVVAGGTTLGVAVAADVAALSTAPLMPVCTVACAFVCPVAIPVVEDWAVAFVSAVPVVVDVASVVAALPSASSCVDPAADVDWVAAASAAAAIASGAVLGPVVAAVVGAVGVLVAVTVTGSMTAMAVGKMPVVTVDDEVAVEPLAGSVVALPLDDDCVLDVEESSFEPADLSLACRGPSLPLAWSVPSALEAGPVLLF